MTDKYQCPKCKSNRIKTGYLDIQCLACGWSEPLIDYPISWEWHRHYCRDYGLPDPGPCEPPEHPELKAIEERLEQLEDTFYYLSVDDLRQYKIKQIYDQVQDIRQGLRHTQQLLARSVRARTRKTKPKTIKPIEE